MEISFKKAILTPFDDENWGPKIGTGVLLLIPSFLAAVASGVKSWEALSLAFVAGFLIGGYAWIIMHNELNNIENVLPEWDFTRILFLAVQGGLISLAYGLIGLPVIGVFIALILFLKKLSIIFIVMAIVIMVFWYAIFIPIAQSFFAKDFDFTRAFDFEKIFDIAKNSWNIYLLALLYSILIGIIYGLFFGIFSGIIGVFNKALSTLIMNISQLLIALSSANLYGQTFKKATENINININV